MADNTPGFNSLDPLGPEYGKINQPIIDPKGLSPFEGDRMRDAPINFPAMPGLDLSLPNRNVRQNAVGAPGKPANANKQATAQDVINAQGSLIKAIGQASQSKDSYAKIYSYNAGPDGNAFYKRYQAYGQEKFDEIGFSPLRDNEATFNARTTRWDDFSRMMTHSFFPLLASGFTSGPRSLFRMLQGDFTGADLEDARLYEEAAAIGQSSKGGVFGFVNNTVMNFGYTVGIISEVILEEMGAALLAPGTGGTSFAAATIRNLERIKGVGTAIKGFKAMRNSLSELKGIQAVRNFKNSVNAGLTSKVGRFLNPLENTFEALQLAKADNLTGLAATFKTAGGLYRDIRTVNMAVSEARLEAGMVENSVYDDLYNEHYNLTGEAPDNKTQQDMQRQAKDASGNTFYWNAGLIYATNKITFNNITGPRGGIRKFIKSVQDDFVSVGGGKFGNVGKIVYDNVAKKFAYEATNLKNLAKSWWKNPGFKTAAGTIGYFKANISEGLQENMQEIISRTNEGYYKDSFNSKARRAQEYARGAALYAGKTQSDYFKKELGEEFSMKGLETFGSGFFMGMLAAPLNNSIPFLSKQWNRMFDQKGYTDYVEKKEKMAEGIVEVLNNIDMKDFIKSNMFNLSAQDFINEIKARASKKEGMDAELEGLIDSVEMMLQTNTTDVFTDHLNSFFDLSEDEFMEAMGNIEKSEIPEYKTRITKSIDKIKSIKKKYDYYKQKKPNPVTDAYLSTLDKDSEEYEEAVSLQAGWDRAVKNAVFFNEAYEDTMQRMVDIQSEFLSKTTLKNMGAREMGLIFQPQKIKNEIELLKNDIEVAEQAKSTLPGAAEDLAKKKRMLAQMEDYAEKFKAFDIFYNRADYYSAHRDEVKKQLGIDLTDEEVEAIFNEQLGALDGTESQAKVLGELKESLANYLKTVADINEDTVFDENIDQGFTLLADHYKLYRESLAMVEAINTLHDPGNFNDLARRNQAWMKDLYNRRAEYYEKIVKGEMEDVEFNALLNKLADSGIAVTPEDFVEWKNNRTIPKEFIDIANKRIIPQNSEKYAAAVDLFERATALRDDTTVVSTEIQDAEYKRQLAALEADMQAEIDALPKVEERLVTGSIEPTAKSKSFTLNKVRKELAIGEQAELVDTKGERIIVRKDENEQLVDEAGELVDNNKRYVAGEKFRMSMVADEAAVKEIEDRYTEKRIALKEKFLAAQENVEKPQVVEEMTIADIMTKEPELYQQLLTAYEAMMVEDMGVDDFATLSDSQRENGLAKFIKSAKGKLIVDAYQEKQKISRSTQTEANEMTFTLDGTSYDTSTITSVPQLRNFIKQFNAKIATIKKKKIQDSADTEAILDLQSMINGMNLLIDKRLQSGATDELKAAIAKIKVMQLNQKDIVKQDLKSITIPKDDRAWKKGDIRYTKQGIRVEYKGDNLYNIAGQDRVFDTSTPNASSFQRSIDTAIYRANPQEVPNVYMIKGTEHERVSYAIKSVYDVFGLNENSLAILNTAFDVTIGTKGFNEESIKAFVDDLRATKESDNGKLGGFSTYTFDEIEGDLLGFYDSMTIMGGAPTSAPINFYQIDSGQIRVSTGDDGSRMVDITSEDFNQIVSQLSPEQKEKFKEYLRAEIEKIPEKRKKAAKGSGYMASNYDQTQVLKLEKELKETLAALEGSAPTSNIDPKRAAVETKLRELAVGLKEEEIQQILDIPIEKIITEVKNRANNNPNTIVDTLVTQYMLRLKAELAAIRIPVGGQTKLIEVVKIIDKLTPSTTSEVEAKKADIEKRREEELTELGQKQLTKGFNSLSEATKPEQVANAIVNIEQNKNQGALLSKEQEQTLSEARAKLKEQGYEIVDYNIVKYGEHTIVEGVDFYNSEKDVLTEEQANAIESKINSLEKRGEEVNVDDLPSPVSRTIKPLIKKDGKMVQAAKVNTLIFESVEQAKEAIIKSREAGNKKPNAADKVNAKYDAELAALGTTTAGVFTPSTPYGTAKGAPLTTASTSNTEGKTTKVISSKIVEKGNRKGQTETVTQTNYTEDVEGTLVSVTEYEAKIGGTKVTLGGRRMTFKEFKEEFPLDEDYEEILGDWPDLNDDTIITVRKVKRTPSSSRFKTVVSIFSPVLGDKMDITIKKDDTKYNAELAAQTTAPTVDIAAERAKLEQKRDQELLFVKPYNQGLETVSLDDINNFSNSFKKDGTTIKVYAATNNKSKLSKEGFSGENTGLGRTKGEAPGTIFLTPFLSTALDYANMYAAEGFPLDQIDIVEVELKNGEGTIEGVEIRTRKESIVSVKALNRKKDSTDKIKKEIIARYAAQLDALEATTQTTTTTGTVDIEEIRKLALNTAAEQSYEASKKVGNYTDAQSKRIFDGEAPEFDEERITKEAYDELFDPKTGYLTQLKERADKGEFFIATDIVVYGEVVDANGKTRRIAGEIDLLIADRDGRIHIIDLKTGTYGKWISYNTKGKIGYNKRIENTLQQMSYSNLVFNQYGLETNIGILPIQAEYDPDSADGKIMKAGRPTTKKLFEDDDMSLLESNKPFSVKLYKNQELQQLDENGEVVNTTAEELIGKIIPRKDGKSGASGPVRPDEDSTEDEAGPTGGTNAPNPTVNKGARQDQVDTYNDLKERIMMANLDELDELNTELFAAKVSSGITDEQYKDLVILLEEAESELSIGEIEAVSINNVKLNSKLIAMDEFTTTTQKGKTTIISIIGANEKVVVAEILKDSIKVRTQDGNLVEVPANKISDIFVDAAKYEDEPGGPMDTPYKPTKEESIVITQTNDNVATFLDDNDAKNEAVQKGQSMKPKDALDDLTNNINCPG